jgi:hypothetical protein
MRLKTKTFSKAQSTESMDIRYEAYINGDKYFNYGAQNLKTKSSVYSFLNKFRKHEIFRKSKKENQTQILFKDLKTGDTWTSIV